jgi:ABC-type iron transport system FetAB permease component
MNLFRITISVPVKQSGNTCFKLLVLENKVRFVNNSMIPILTLSLFIIGNVMSISNLTMNKKSMTLEELAKKVDKDKSTVFTSL